MKMERVWVVWLVWAAMVAAALQGTSGCLEKERMGLIELGKSVKPNQLTALPRDTDCCSWNGAICSATTGRVERLHLCSLVRYYLRPVYDAVLNVSLLLPFEELLELRLHGCGFHGLINQADLMKLTKLETLRINDINMSNIVSFQDFANIKNLKDLDLWNNFMPIDLKDICEMKNIIKLILRSNAIRGHLPSCIGNLTQLQVLSIGYNQISGNIPSTIGNLSHLSHLSLEKNYWSGSFSLHSLANNSKLESLYLSSHHNQFHVETETQSWFPSFQLNSLFLTNSNINKMSDSVIPTFLLHQSQLSLIDLSHNNLHDIFPSWLLQNNSQLMRLWMSNNSLTGNPILPSFIHSLLYIDISNNRIGGKLYDNLQVFLPSIVSLSDELSINSSLVTLDLSYNAFSHNTIPNWIYSQRHLRILLLAGLQLEGEISTHLCELQYIKIMDLSHNNFNGSIPSCLFKMLFWVARSQDDYVDQIQNASFPIYPFQSISQLFDLELPTKGTPVRLKRNIFSLMNGLDVSSNKLSGQIPPQIGDSAAIHSLNLSNNRLWGSIPTSISRLTEIENLDLSSNNLSGKIPPEIVRLNFLSTFNVSNNNLSGPTPNGGQFYNFDERSYGGNEFMCGPLLHRLCTTSSSPSTTPPDEQEDDDETIC